MGILWVNGMELYVFLIRNNHQRGCWCRRRRRRRCHHHPRRHECEWVVVI